VSKELDHGLFVRPAQLVDLPALATIDMGYESTACYRVRKQVDQGRLQYTLTLESLEQPYRIEYDAWDWTEVPGFLQNLKEERVLGAFNATSQGTACVGILELNRCEAQQAGEIASLYVHRPLRGKGIGKALVSAGLEWARQQKLRALLVTTQVVDVPAIDFYQKLGFIICGIHDHFYHNDDLANDETAVFLVHPLN
jgi:ribosomal protein S18 acetylase RimI-like enzyme